MKNNQKGFSTVEILLVLVVAVLVGGIGYFVYNSQIKTNQILNDTSKSTSQTQGVKKKTATQETTASTNSSATEPKIHEVDIKLQTEADIDKLPSYTPASFKTYLLPILKDNKFVRYSANDVDTIQQYQIDKISQVNISGGEVPVDKNGEGQIGGAPAIWVLTPQGTWDQETLNGPVCKSKNGGLIYVEFAKECSDSTGARVKNPNGSATSLKS